MPQIGNWIKRAVQKVLDPDHDERIQEVATLLHKSLLAERDAFSIQQFKDKCNYTEHDLKAAKGKIYRPYLERAWNDDVVTQAERKTLAWLAQRLEMQSADVQGLEADVARKHFSDAFQHAVTDGVIDEPDARRLGQIAQAVGMSVGEFVKAHFHSQAEAYLKSAFAECILGNALSTQAWQSLLVITQRLGLPKQELLVTVRPQAEQFVEHVLVDAKSDGILTAENDNVLTHLVELFELSPAFRDYVNSSVADLRMLRFIREGKLPVVNAPIGVSINAGEIVHFHSAAIWMQKRILKSGETWDQHTGTLTITDNRLLFSSDTKSFGVRFGRIVAHSGGLGRIHLQRAEKPEAVIKVSESKPLAYAILDAAIAFANQTRIAKLDETSSRFIPREVRQRVWQRYGGRCADCGANQYLEFDHIVPVAKGGSNSDENVQLLCRNCNLKKSDRI